MRLILSGFGEWRYLDCVSIRAGKQEALEYVRQLFNVPVDRCMAAGDSGNDTLMLAGGLRLVSDAQCGWGRPPACCQLGVSRHAVLADGVTLAASYCSLEDQLHPAGAGAAHCQLPVELAQNRLTLGAC